MFLDNVEKLVGARFGAAFDDVGRGGIAASEAIRILPDPQFLLEGVGQEDQPLVELCTFGRSDLRGESCVSMLIDEMEHDSCGLGHDQIAVNQSWYTSVRIDL